MLNVAICQAAPIPLDFDGGIEKAIRLAREAIEGGAQVVAFGETFLGGYPLWLDESPGAALWDHPGTRACHNILLDQAIVPGDERLLPLQELCDASGALISIGAHERLRSSLYNNQLLFRPGMEPLDHRKLVPTHGERLIWMRGDGSTLNVQEAEWGRAGNLICWEHWMPLTRQTMHNSGEHIHVAVWPKVHEMLQIATRSYAFEGRCYAVGVGQIMRVKDIPAELNLPPKLQDKPDHMLLSGGSCIVGPDGHYVLEPQWDVEGVFTAEVDLSKCYEERLALDVTGHYQRNDVFELAVNKKRH